MIRTLTLVVLRSVAVVLLLALVAPFGWRAVTGDTFMQVTSGSMEPTYLVGDVLSVRPAEGDELTEVGREVVVAFGAAGGNARYVHRVDEVIEDGAWLRGDNNSERDPQPVNQGQVEGTPRFALTGTAAEVFTFSQSITGRAVIVVAALVFLFVPVPRATKRGASGERSASDDRSASDEHTDREPASTGETLTTT